MNIHTGKRDWRRIFSQPQKSTLKGFAKFILGRQSANNALRGLIIIRAWFLRALRLIKNGVQNQPIPFPLKTYGDDAHQVFFGYYDISPVNFDDSIILAVRASILNVPPKAGTPIEIGYYHIKDNNDEFAMVARTATWCWQQGCRLQWYPLKEQGKNNLIIYNTIVNNHYGCCIQDILSKKILSRYRRPIYSLSSDGRLGLSLNFSRLGRLRPGYGYVTFPDETEPEMGPKKDGIWYLDLNTGENKLLFSIADIVQLEPLKTMQGAVHYFNHIFINPDGSRFLFFHVWLQKGRKYTRLITCNMDGSEPYPLINEGHVSHYTWKSVDELLCFSTHADSGMKYHLYKDKTSYREVIADGLLKEDGHPSYSPDGKFILTDTYPDKYNDRHLLLFEVSNERILNLGRFFSPYRYIGELRCDLHPRWSPSGRYIAFDSAHEEKRSMYAIDLSPK